MLPKCIKNTKSHTTSPHRPPATKQKLKKAHRLRVSNLGSDRLRGPPVSMLLLSNSLTFLNKSKIYKPILYYKSKTVKIVRSIQTISKHPNRIFEINNLRQQPSNSITFVSALLEVSLLCVVCLYFGCLILISFSAFFAAAFALSFSCLCEAVLILSFPSLPLFLLSVSECCQFLF
jgi:hypothetical protein